MISRFRMEVRDGLHRPVILRCVRITSDHFATSALMRWRKSSEDMPRASMPAAFYPSSEGKLPDLLTTARTSLAGLPKTDQEWIFAKTAQVLYPALAD